MKKDFLKAVADKAYQASREAQQAWLASHGEHPFNCGMAYALVPKKQLSLRNKAVKELVAEHILSDWDYNKAISFKLPICSQDLDVRLAGAIAAVEVLKSYGFSMAYTIDRMD